MSKLTRGQIWIIFGVIALIAILSMVFLWNKPLNEKITVEQERFNREDPVAQQLDPAKKDLVKAKAEVVTAKNDWGIYENRLMPKIDVTNLYTGWQQLTNEQLKYLGPNLEKFVRADKSVQILQANFALPAPPDDPNQVNSPIFVFSPGSVQVSGTFENILKHVERWNKFPRLVMVTGFQLAGNSPQLVGQYSLQVFEFTRGEKPGDTFPAAAGAGGGGGGMGGMMGGGGMSSSMMGGGPSMGGGMSSSMGGGPGMGGNKAGGSVMGAQ
jgi:hypothetical protein